MLVVHPFLFQLSLLNLGPTQEHLVLVFMSNSLDNKCLCQQIEFNFANPSHVHP